MAELGAVLFILFMLLCWASNFFNLPGNWINFLLLALWKWTHPDITAGWIFFIGIFILAFLAELIEFFSQIWGSRKYGGTNKGSWAAFFGAFFGAILGAPFFLGVGAILGAIAGAFAGSLIAELLDRRTWFEAFQASKGAMWGKVLGIIAKAGLGMLMITLSISKIWP